MREWTEGVWMNFIYSAFRQAQTLKDRFVEKCFRLNERYVT
jgi:hypothetical protein